MYKSHLDDPLSFQDGGSLLYRIGALFSDWLPWSEVPLSCLLLTGDQRLWAGCLCLPWLLTDNCPPHGSVWLFSLTMTPG